MANALAWYHNGSLIISDGFVTVSDVNLNTHTTNEGYAWVKWSPGGSSPDINDIASTSTADPQNQASSNGELYYVNHTMPSPNYTASCVFSADSAAVIELDLGIRYQDGDATHLQAYFIAWFPDLNEARLYRVTTGVSTQTQLGSSLSTTGLGPHTATITAIGQTISATFDGVTVATVQDNYISAAGFVAIGGGLRNGRFPNNGAHYATLSASTV